MAFCENSCNTNTLCGTNMACVTQIPGSEVLIQPVPFAVTIPGPVLSASCEPVLVAQNNPCAPGYGGYPYVGYGCGGYSYGRRSGSYPCSYPGYAQKGSYSCGPC